jgi:hypothetical protein
MAVGIAHWLDLLPSMHEALGLIPQNGEWGGDLATMMAVDPEIAVWL